MFYIFEQCLFFQLITPAELTTEVVVTYVCLHRTPPQTVPELCASVLITTY